MNAHTPEPDHQELPVAALALTACVTLAAMALGGGLGWLMTVPLVGLYAHLWPRRAALTPVLGLGMSAALYSLARAVGAPEAPLLPTVTLYLLLAGSLALASTPAARLRRQLNDTSARVATEQTVLEVMAQIAQLSARAELSPLEVARLALELAQPVLPLDGAMLVSGTGSQLGDLPPGDLLSGPGATFPASWFEDPGSGFWQAHQEQQATYLNEASTDPRWRVEGVSFSGAVAVLPLHLPCAQRATLLVRRQTGPLGARWGVHDRQLLGAAARAVRLAAERQEHLQALEYSANHDALTGSLNRHAFTLALRQLAQGPATYTLALMDLDGFKALNDREGHARGDEALCAFAAEVNAAFGPHGALYRLGGDEFALILREFPAQRQAEMLHMVGEVPQTLRRGGLNLAGVSVGAAHGQEAPDAQAVLALADQRMYEMKHRELSATGQPRTASGQTRPARQFAAPIFGPGQTALPANDLQPAGQEGSSSQKDAMQLLGVVLEARDAETHHHSVRVVQWALALGEQLHLGPDQLAGLEQGAYLHDLGKLVVPDRVLLKPGPLNAEEWVLMRSHAEEGHRMARRLPFLHPLALEVIRSHHERWDGGGYPDGLAREHIPLLARLYAVVDVFDALISRRPYKAAWTAEQALAELQAQAGRHFDPEIVTAFMAVWSRAAEQPSGESARPRQEHKDLLRSEPVGAPLQTHHDRPQQHQL